MEKRFAGRCHGRQEDAMSNLVCDLTNRNCKACEGGVPALGEAEAAELLKQVEGWTLEGDRISKKYTFKNYYHTMAFVNALAWISHRENHHPNLEVGWGHCTVTYSTHAINGLSENDFICAAKCDALFKL